MIGQTNKETDKQRLQLYIDTGKIVNIFPFVSVQLIIYTHSVFYTLITLSGSRKLKIIV